jgi:hypothetical protein
MAYYTCNVLHFVKDYVYRKISENVGDSNILRYVKWAHRTQFVYRTRRV